MQFLLGVTLTPSPSPLPHFATDQIEPMIQEAIKMGYRHIDCAEVFLHCEQQVGFALQTALTDNNLHREDIFITSKYPCKQASCLEACKTSLSKLKVEYLDLYVVHYAEFTERCKESTSPEPLSPESPLDRFGSSNMTRFVKLWRDMENLVFSGHVKQIGIVGFPNNELDSLSFTKIKPVLVGPY